MYIEINMLKVKDVDDVGDLENGFVDVAEVSVVVILLFMFMLLHSYVDIVYTYYIAQLKLVTKCCTIWLKSQITLKSQLKT